MKWKAMNLTHVGNAIEISRFGVNNKYSQNFIEQLEDGKTEPVAV
jgi:hypothetical protein